MDYAFNRIPSAAAARAGHKPFGPPMLVRDGAGSDAAIAAAGQVLDQVLDDCVGWQQQALAMRSGARVTMLRDEWFEAAVRLYRRGHWAIAFERFATLADHQDHAPAARLALLMMRYGKPLYGVAFSARPTQVARWAQRVLRASSRETASPSSITASA